MASKVLTIAIGTDSAKISEVQLSGKKVIVFNAYDVDFSEGLCEDGLINDTEGLAEEIRDFIRAKGIKTKKIVYSIASKRIASKEVIIPFVKQNKIGSIVKINAAEYFPISNLEDYSINYSILEEVKDEDKKQYRLSVTATPNELLKNYYELAEILKMSIETIDYSGNSILQILELQTQNEINAILQLGRENTVINIMNGKVLVMQRSVSYGMDAIINAVMDTLHLDEEDAFAFIEDNDISRICKAYSDVDEVVSVIFSGIGRIFEFYSTRNQENPIAGIKFVGDGTSINGIGDAIEANFGIATEEILTLKNVDVKKKHVTPEQATNFMANIGAVISPMNIEYVSKEDSERRTKDEEKLPWWLLVLSVVGAAVLLGSTGFLYYTTKNEKDELQRQVESLESMQQVEDQLFAAESKRDVVKNFYSSTKGANDSISAFIKDLETILPKGTSLDSLNIQDGVVSISVGGVGKQSAAKLLQGLRNLSYVSNINIDYVSEINTGIDVYDNYSMSFTISEIVEEEIINIEEDSANANMTEEVNENTEEIIVQNDNISEEAE